MTAAGKINLALVVGPRRDDGMHEVATVLQRIDLADELALDSADALMVEGFAEDTIVHDALVQLAETAGVEPRWRVRIQKRIPVAVGLGGGSADAAAALTLANETLGEPLPPAELLAVAAAVGSDVPFFLEPGPKLAEGLGERLSALDLPQDYAIVIAVPDGARKHSTGDVYRAFDALGLEAGFRERKERLVAALTACSVARDLARLPENDLPAATVGQDVDGRLYDLGAFRVDMTGAGPALYGLFDTRDEAERAARALEREAQVWAASPVW